MVNSKKKGSRRELEVVNLLKEHGFTARRSAQYMGTPTSSDVLCEELKDFNIECKGVQTLGLEKVVKKCLADAPELVPFIIHKRNRECWKVTMRAEDLLTLFRHWLILKTP